MDEVMDAALKWGKALEINSYYERLDLDDIQCRRVKSGASGSRSGPIPITWIRCG